MLKLDRKPKQFTFTENREECCCWPAD